MFRVIGGTQMPGDFNYRWESNFRKWEYYIDDHLDSVNNLRIFRGDKQKSDTIFVTEPGVHNIEIKH